MQHFPSLSEDELQRGCRVIYERAIRAVYTSEDVPIQLTMNSGVLFIKKEYPVGAPSEANERIVEFAQNEDDELVDDDDEQVGNDDNHMLAQA